MTSTGTSYTDSNGKAVAVAERLDELRELIAKGPYLMLRMDDSYLMRYLCSDDFNAREAYERVCEFGIVFFVENGGDFVREVFSRG